MENESGYVEHSNVSRKKSDIAKVTAVTEQSCIEIHFFAFKIEGGLAESQFHMHALIPSQGEGLNRNTRKVR